MRPATVLVLALLVTSCGGDDDPEPAPAQAPPPVAALPPPPPPAAPPATPPVEPETPEVPPAEPPAEPINAAPVIQSVIGPSSGLPGELVTLEIEWMDDDGDDVTIAVEQVAGTSIQFTRAGNLVMFEVPDVDEGPIFVRVRASDGKAMTVEDFRFYVLPAPMRYTIKRIPPTLRDDRIGMVEPFVLTNDGHVGGRFIWETELESWETDPPFPNWTGVIWLDGASSLIDVNDWFHDEPLLHVGNVYILTDDFEVAGTAQDFGKTDEFDRPSSYNYTWSLNEGFEIFWEGVNLFDDGRMITHLGPAYIAPDSDVIGFDGSGWARMFRWDGDAVHFWCYRDERFPENADCPEKAKVWETPVWSEDTGLYECIAHVIDDRGKLYEWEFRPCPSRWLHLFERQWGPFGEEADLFLPEIEGTTLRLQLAYSEYIADMNDHDSLLVEGCLVEWGVVEAELEEEWWQQVECGSYVLTPQ